MQRSLFRGAFAHRSSYTEKFLHTEAFTRRSTYIQSLLHRKACMQRSFLTEKPCHSQRISFATLQNRNVVRRFCCLTFSWCERVSSEISKS